MAESKRVRALASDQRLIDTALVLGCLALTVLAVKGRWSPLPRPVIALAGGLGSLAQIWRRDQPLTAGLAGAAGSVLSGNPGPLLVGLYSGATYAPRTQVWLLGLAGWAGLTGLSWLDAGGLQVQDTLAWALVTALVVAVGVNLATRRLLVASLRERAERAAAERALRDEQARAAERTRIAREMHDVLAHKVSLIALHAGALEVDTSGDPERVRQGAGLIRVTAREALRELREVLGVLQSAPGGDQLAAAWFPDLAALVAASVQAGQAVDLDDQAGELPAATARVVGRVVQEALTNARKHAPGGAVSVSLRGRAGAAVTVAVANGPGTEPAMDLPGSGAGLVGLAERLRLVGGSLASGPDGRGWRLEAVVPWLDQRVEALVDGSQE